MIPVKTSCTSTVHKVEFGASLSVSLRPGMIYGPPTNGGNLEGYVFCRSMSLGSQARAHMPDNCKLPAYPTYDSCAREIDAMDGP